MISEEELAELRSKEAAMAEQQGELMGEVRRLRQLVEETKETRKRIASVKQITADEEKKAQKEIAKLQKKRNSTEEKMRAVQEKGKTGFSLNTIKLATDEMKLKTSQEKLTKVRAKLEGMEEQLVRAKEAETKVSDEVEAFESYCARMEEMAKQVTPCARMMMKIVDLEGELARLSKQESMANRQSVRIGAMIEVYERAISEKRRKLEESVGVIEPNKGMLVTMSALLKNKMDEIEMMKERVKGLEEDAARETAAQSSIRKEIDAMKQEFSEYEKSCNETIKGLSMNFEEEIREASEKAAIEVHKRKTLISQLEQQLGNVRTGIATKPIDQSDVCKLTDQLEAEWKNHQIASDQYQKGKTRIEKLRVILDHKLEVIKDLEEWCPLSSKPKVSPGLNEFMFLFDVVFTRNREMAQQLNLITTELEHLQAEHDQLTC